MRNSGLRNWMKFLLPLTFGLLCPIIIFYTHSPLVSAAGYTMPSNSQYQYPRPGSSDVTSPPTSVNPPLPDTYWSGSDTCNSAVPSNCSGFSTTPLLDATVYATGDVDSGNNQMAILWDPSGAFQSYDVYDNGHFPVPNNCTNPPNSPVQNNACWQATRPDGGSVSTSNYEVIVPSAMIGTGVQVTIVNFCRGVQDANGWEDHTFSSPLTRVIGTSAQTITSGGGAVGQTVNTCSGPDMVVTLTPRDFNNANDLGPGMQRAVVSVQDGSANNSEIQFSVGVSYGAFIGPLVGASWPGHYSNVKNPSADYYYWPASNCLSMSENPPAGSQKYNVASTPNCPANQDFGTAVGGYSTMNVPPDSQAPQTSVYQPPGYNRSTTYSPANGVNTYHFYFCPDQNYTAGANVRLWWRDGAGNSNTQMPGENWYLRDTSTGAIVANTSNTTGIFQDVGPLTQGDVYDWTWQGVDRAHGLSVQMPFSEYTATSTYNCQKPQQPCNNTNNKCCNGSSNPCAAMCQITSIVGTLPGGYVQVGQPFTVNATIFNVSPGGYALPPTLNIGGTTYPLNFGNFSGGAPLSDYIFSNDLSSNSGVPIPSGGSINISFIIPVAVASPNPSTVVGSPMYAGPFTNLPYSQRYCQDPAPHIDAYTPFNLTVGSQATLLPTKQNPTSWTYTTSVTSTAPVPVSVPTYSSVYSIPVATGVKNYIYNNFLDSGPFPTGTTAVPLPPGGAPIPAGVNAGDQYCADIFSPAPGVPVPSSSLNGFVDPNGLIVDLNGTSANSSCESVSNEPYFKVYGSGVSAGGSMAGGSCSNTGVIGGWNDNTGVNPLGAGAEFETLALGNIEGFASSQNSGVGGGASQNGSGLTFANSGAITPSNPPKPTSMADSPFFGGQYGSTNCHTLIQPPASMTSFSSPSTITVGAAGLHDGAYNYTGGGTLTINGGTLNPGDNLTIYVPTGNVYITTNDINYKQTGWTASNVPSFVLLVGTGNIYIDAGIEHLDGLYVAQNSAGTGKIYTCTTSPGGTLLPNASLFGSCNRQLYVHGAMVTDQLNLQRTVGSLRDSYLNESPQSPPIACSNQNTGGAVKLTCAAEVFEFSPEMYLSNPSVLVPGATRYDSITSLPPVL